MLTLEVSIREIYLYLFGLRLKHALLKANVAEDIAEDIDYFLLVRTMSCTICTVS